MILTEEYWANNYETEAAEREATKIYGAEMAREIRVATGQINEALNNEEVMEVVRNVSLELLDCPEIMKVAVAASHEALGFASDRLKDDIQIVSLACDRNGEALKFASARIRSDPVLAAQCLRTKWFYSENFEHVDTSVKDDKRKLLTFAQEVWKGIPNDRKLRSDTKWHFNRLIKEIASSELQAVIAEDDPIQALHKSILADKLGEQLKHKPISKALKL